MNYGEFIDGMNQFVATSKIDARDPLVRNAAGISMNALSISITQNSPILMNSPEGQPLERRTVITEKIARDTIERLAVDLREQRAGVNLIRLLNEEEKLSYDELLGAVGMCKGNLDNLYEFVYRRNYLRNISVSSPLYPLIQCILQKRDNYTELLEQEVADNGMNILEVPPTTDVDKLLRGFNALLKMCMDSDC